MIQRHNIVNFGIIGLSAFLFAGTIALSLGAMSNHLKTNVLEGSEVIAGIKAPVSYEAHISEGDQLFSQGLYTKAALEYALAIPIQSDNPSAYAKLGKAYIEAGDLEKAASQLKKALELAPSQPEYQTLYAKALIRKGDYEQAQTILAPFESHQRALFYKGILAILSNDHSTAKKRFQAAKEVTGDLSPQTLDAFIQSYDRFEAGQEGQNVFLNALLVKALSDAKEFRVAEELAIRILNEKNDYRDVWILLGYAQLKNKKFAQAEDAFKQAIYLDSLKAEAHYFLGMSQYQQDQYDEAAESFERALLHGFEPENEVYKTLAESYVALERYEDALAAYEFLLANEANDIDLYLNPVWISIHVLKDLDRAQSLAKQSVDQFPNSVQSHSLLAWVEILNGDLDAARESVDTAFMLDRNYPDNYYNAGLIEEAEGDSKAAKEHFKRAYTLTDVKDPIHKLAAEKYNSLLKADAIQP